MSANYGACWQCGAYNGHFRGCDTENSMPAELDAIAERLRIARVEAGLSLREAAKFLEMPPSRLSDLEHGREEPYIGTAEKMFRVYGYFQGRKIEGREFSPMELESIWQEHKHAERQIAFWRGSPRRA